jgi:hypothetical protein
MNVQMRVHILRTTENINSSSTRSHASEEENRTAWKSRQNLQSVNGTIDYVL